MAFKNELLGKAFGDTASIKPLTVAEVGVGEKTKEWFKVVRRSGLDVLTGVWPDGKIIGTIYGLGDGAVLQKSGQIDGAKVVTLTSNHGDLPDNSINNVMDELALNKGNYPVGDKNSFPNSEVFYLGSPALMKLNCDGKTVASSQNFLIKKTDTLKNCQLQVVGQASDTYHLVAGNTNSDNWQYFEHKIGVGKSDVYIISPGGKKIKPDKIALIKMIIEKIDDLDRKRSSVWLRLAKVSIGMDDPEMCLKAMANFQKVDAERTKSKEIVDDLKWYEDWGRD